MVILSKPEPISPATFITKGIKATIYLKKKKWYTSE
jgi:hypothetical protein